MSPCKFVKLLTSVHTSHARHQRRRMNPRQEKRFEVDQIRHQESVRRIHRTNPKLENPRNEQGKFQIKVHGRTDDGTTE